MDAKTWDERYAASEYVWTDRANRFVEEHLADLEPGTAIDLAAGEGRNAVWLAQRGWTVTAVDFSSVGIDKARRLAADHDLADSIDFVVGDALTHEPAGPVDLVVLSYLQIPEAEQRHVLDRAASWVAPGGTLFVVAHDRSNVDHGHGGPSSEHVCYDLDRTVESIGPGFEVHRAEVAERPVETPDGDRVALDTVVLATRPPT